MSYQQKIIRQLTNRYPAHHLLGLIYLRHRTTCHLSSNQWEQEVRLAIKQANTMTTLELDELADSFAIEQQSITDQPPNCQ